MQTVTRYFQSNEVEETMKRIQSHKGVVGTIVVNSEGIITFNVSKYLIYVL